MPATRFYALQTVKEKHFPYTQQSKPTSIVNISSHLHVKAQHPFILACMLYGEGAYLSKGMIQPMGVYFTMQITKG